MFSVRPIKMQLLVVLFVFFSAVSYGQSAKELFNNANEKLDKMRFKEAIELYDKAISINKNYADAYYNRGIAKNNINDTQGALADFSKTIAIKPNFAAAYNNRGLIRKSLQDYKGAMSDYDTAIANDSLFAVAFLNRGSLKIILEQKEGACVDFRTASALGSQKAFESIVKFCE